MKIKPIENSHSPQSGSDDSFDSTITLKCGQNYEVATDGIIEAKKAKSLPEVTAEHGSLPGARDHNIFFLTLMLLW